MKTLAFRLILAIMVMQVGVVQSQNYGGGCQPTGDDTNYPAIAEFVTAGVYGGIPEITNIKATLNPGDNIQQAIDNGGAGVVYLNNGNYTIYEPIYLRNNVVLRGQSKNGVKLKSIMYATGTKVNTLGIGADVSYAGIEDLTIEYAGATDIEPIVRNSLTDGGYCAECFTNDPYGRDSLYVRLIFIGGDNNWVDNCNVIKSGTDPIYITGSASHNTIRGTLVDHSYNKGDAGNGYFDIRGSHNLITGCTVRRIRHCTIQLGAIYNVVINNHIEVDVNFHNGDGGYNLIEGNTLLRPSWHAWTNFTTGGSVYGHQPPGPNNYILNNTTYDYKDGISKFSDPDVIYTFLTYGSPTPTTWNVPTSGGTFYPVSCTSTNATIPLTSISTSSTLELLPGLYTTLPISYLPENASSKSVVWSSSNTSVAAVNSSGTVTAIAAGTATITATASGHTASCTASVVADTTISLTETFENMTLSGWGSETYIGDYGVEWTVIAKGVSGYINPSKGIYFHHNNQGIVLQSGTIPGGISSFSVTCKDLFNTGARVIELLINDNVVDSFTHNGTEVYTYTVDSINISGDFTIAIRNASGSAYSNTIAIDNVTWTGYIAPITIVLAPLADAFVKGGADANINFGTDATLIVKESTSDIWDRRSFLKFDLSAIIGTVTTAKIRLKVSAGSAGAIHKLHAVTNDNWTESGSTGITWGNQPATSSLISTQTVPSTNGWMEFDVTTLVNNETDSILTVRISDASTAENFVSYHSKEATNANERPQLEIIMPAPLILNTVEDTYIRGGSRMDTNFGTEATIEVKESFNEEYDRKSFLKFDISSAITGTVSDAKIRLKVQSKNASTSHNLYLVTDDSWAETFLKWNNQPSASTLIGTQAVPAVDSWIEFDVTSIVNNEADNLLSVQISNPIVNEALVSYHSREVTNVADRPQLVYTLSNTKSSTISASRLNSSKINNDVTEDIKEVVFTIYPNPANDQINILGTGLKGATAILKDLSGKSILQKRLSEDTSAVLKVNTIQEGIYILMIVKNDGESIIRKIIIQK